MTETIAIMVYVVVLAGFGFFVAWKAGYFDKKNS